MQTVPCYSVPPPNEKSKIIKSILFWMWVWQILIAAAKGYFLSKLECISEIVAVAILWFAFNSLNYCNCVFYIFICLMNALFILITLATKIQDGVVINDFSNQDQKIFIILSTVSFVFYIVTIHFAFQAYKEFKGIAYDILVATQNHEQSILGQNHSPAKVRNSPSMFNSGAKFEKQDSAININSNDDLKKYKHK